MFRLISRGFGLVDLSLTDLILLPAIAATGGYGSPRFLEVAQGFHPRGIPRSEARGGVKGRDGGLEGG